MRFVELLGAFGAADLDYLAAELHLDRVGVELAVASRTGVLVHKFSPSLRLMIPGTLNRAREGPWRCQIL